MARRRRLKKSDGGDLEVHKQNVASSDQVVTEEIVVSSNELQIAVFSDQPIGEQNVGPSKLRHQKENVVSSDMKIRN
jgi:hypothetical protein